MSERPTREEPPPISRFFSIENMPAVVSTATAVLLLVSAIHLTGYFLLVGSQFQALLSPSDYIVDSIEWLPYILAMYVGGKIIARRVTQNEDNTSANNFSYFYFWILIVFLALGAVISSDRAKVSAALSGVAFIALVPFLNSLVHLVFSEPIAKERGDWIGASLAIVTIVLVWGLGKAAKDIDNAQPNYKISLARGDKIESKDIVLFQNISKGLIYRDLLRGEIQFVRWEDIKEFIEIGPKPSTKTLPCEYFGVLCSLSDMIENNPAPSERPTAR